MFLEYSTMSSIANEIGKTYDSKIFYDKACILDEFWSEYGVRTMAKNEPAYNTAETSNPSNWQDPIWIISTYIVFKGLLNYGYINEAIKIAENALKNLYRDICENGAMHKYYNPETGKNDINLGFMNWNDLAELMIKELHGYEEGVDKDE